MLAQDNWVDFRPSQCFAAIAIGIPQSLSI